MTDKSEEARAEKLCHICDKPESTRCIIDKCVRWGPGFVDICRECYAEKTFIENALRRL